MTTYDDHNGKEKMKSPIREIRFFWGMGLRLMGLRSIF
jgi:hypothetical protein